MELSTYTKFKVVFGSTTDSNTDLQFGGYYFLTLLFLEQLFLTLMSIINT